MKIEVATCKVCNSRCAEIGPDGRCRLCRDAKAASDAGMSYGKFKAMIYEKYGETREPPPDLYQTCPECGKIFIPQHRNRIYCCTNCQNRQNQRKWQQRKKKKEAYVTDTTDQNGGRAHQNEPVAKGEKKGWLSNPEGKAPDELQRSEVHQ